MDDITYWFGVLFAIIGGIVANLGLLCQKKVINELPRREQKFMKSLIRKPLWLVGLILNMGIAGIFYMLAQFYIGPTLVPGLLALGIIFLAIGSVKIIGDKLNITEIIAIILMIIATFLLSFSGLSIAISETNFLNNFLIYRIAILTTTLFLLIIIFEIVQRKSERFKGFFLAFIAGLSWSMTDFWVSPFVGMIYHFFEGIFVIGEIILFIISTVIFIITNVLAVIKLQQSFKYGVASNMVVIQNVPANVIPIMIYFLVYLLTPPSDFSTVFIVLGTILVIMSSYLLGARQAKLEEIK